MSRAVPAAQADIGHGLGVSERGHDGRDGWEVAPGFWVWPLRTPTLPPATTTNTAVIGDRSLLVVEPATPHAEERARLAAWLDTRVAAGARVEAVAITHHHTDHVGWARGVADQFGVPLWAHPATAARVEFTVDRQVQGGDVLELGDGRRIEACFTPGHAPGHVCFVDRATGVVHAGDMVAGEGFVMIDPDDGGDMSVYLKSLGALLALDAKALVPAHGPVLEAPASVLRAYVEHRLAREGRVRAALEDGRPADLETLLARTYHDTPRAHWPLARKSLRAHLAKLVEDGEVRRVGLDYVVG